MIEREDGAILGIEVKAGTSLNEKIFKHLEWFKSHTAKDKPFVGIILYSGNKPIKFKMECGLFLSQIFGCAVHKPVVLGDITTLSLIILAD